MVKRLKTNLEMIEAMLYFWQATSEKERVGESYLNTIASTDVMKNIYDEEFNGESVRKVLSAISNREMFSGKNKKEGRFWNNNMWMLEDLEYTNMMVQPIKVLNLDGVYEKCKSFLSDCLYEEIEVIFVPEHLNEYKILDNKLIINFFRIKPSLYEDKTEIGDQEISEYIGEKIEELCRK